MYFIINPYQREKKLVGDDVAALYIPPNPISKKWSYNHIKKFQDLWVVKLPWVNMCLGSDGLLHNVKCKICKHVEGKDKLFAIKWDSLCKHTCCKNIGSMKKGEWYYTKSCNHVKNHVKLDSCKHQMIIQQVANGIVRKRPRKVMKFTIILHLL